MARRLPSIPYYPANEGNHENLPAKLLNYFWPVFPNSPFPQPQDVKASPKPSDISMRVRHHSPRVLTYLQNKVLTEHKNRPGSLGNFRSREYFANPG
jgi:hypothetical protein